MVAISIGAALLTEASLYYTDRSGDEPVNVKLDLYHQFPDWFQTIFHSGISAGALCAIILNLLLNTKSTSIDPVDYHNTGEIDVAPSASDAPRGPAFDPATHCWPPTRRPPRRPLRYLAQRDEGLHPFIVTNPSAPKELCDWIKSLGDPKVLRLFEKWDGYTHGDFSKRGSQ